MAKPKKINDSITQRAKLWCDAKRQPTWHRYIGTYPCILPKIAGPNGEPMGGPAWEHIYQCEVTGAQRRWGADERSPSSFDVETN